MNGALPMSDDFLYWDPENVMDYLAPMCGEHDGGAAIDKVRDNVDEE